MKKTTIFITFLFIFTQNIFAGIIFSNGDINKKDEILFNVGQNIPGTYKYETLIKTQVENLKKTEILTCFPEQMELLSHGNTLQLRNRYGIAQIDLKTNKFNWKFQKNFIPTNSSRLSSYSVSPNGEWLCYFQKTDWATGMVILENINSGKRKTIIQNANFNYEKIPVKWSQDSTLLVYEKNENLYFCNPEGLFKGLEVQEKFRKIGKGTINSVNFAGGKYLIYIEGDLIYKIGVKEMYTTTLYSQIIGKGKAIGRLPSSFNPKKDIFSCNDYLSGIFVIQNDKFFNYYKINSPLCQYLDVEFSGPFFDTESSLLDTRIFWSDYAKPVVWIRCLPYNGEKVISKAFEVSKQLKKVIEVEESGLPYLSPDLQKIAFFSEDKVFVYNTITWEKLREISGEKIVSIIWKNNDTLILGGEKTIRDWNIKTNIFSTIFLSSCDNGYFSKDNKIFAEFNSGTTFYFNQQEKTWKTVTDATTEKNNLSNGKYRIFCGTTPNSDYENAIYVRTLTNQPKTVPIYSKSVQKKSDSKKVALIFDAYDNSDGLTKILYELKKYRVEGTFFINGEFIRRYPNETRQIANSANECASMFFSAIDLTENEYIISEEFIRRGLARNEDEFFDCTQKEISLFWHAPYYNTTPEINKFAENSGYTTVSKKIKNSDIVTLEQAIFQNKKYISPSKLIDEIMQTLNSNNGGIVPITVGISNGSRTEYLYDNLALLLSAILDEGFKIVQCKYLN